MLPIGSDHDRSITAVLPRLLQPLGLVDERTLPGAQEVTAVMLIVVDGLGWVNLMQRKAYARFLVSQPSTRIGTVVPSTTGAALTSLLTASMPGSHGLFGYRQFDPANQRLRSTLTDWDDLVDVTAWMTAPPVTGWAQGAGLHPVAIGRPRHAQSGLTRALLRGAQYMGGVSIADRFELARQILSDAASRFVYLYIDELDRAGHVAGWQSTAWEHALEELDAEVARFASTLPAGVRCVLTADHGIVDVPPERHRFMDADPALLEGVSLIGGEPRFRHLYLHNDASATDRVTLADTWRIAEGSRAAIWTRESAIAAGLFGEVDETLYPRIGDVLVAARKQVAYYTSDPADEASRRMIGQHGGISEDETQIPLIEVR